MMKYEWILGTLLIPLFLGFFKQELIDFFTDLRIYQSRDIDGDGDPATGRNVYIQCEPDNYVEITVLEYQFSLIPHHRRVITLQKAKIDSEESIIVSYTYAQWNSIIKGTLTDKVLDKNRLRKLVCETLGKDIDDL